MGATVHEVNGVPLRAGISRWRHALAWAPVLTMTVFLLPVVAGVVGTLLPAFGYLPALGGGTLSLEPWRTLCAQPGFATSVLLTLSTGFAATVLSVVLALGLCAFAYGRPSARRLSAVLAPLLSTPHSALAIGLAFLVAPSGWLVRALSPWLTGWTLPPDVATVGHPSGWPLVVALLLKEVPYLVLMTLGALNQVPAARQLDVARSLGYGRSVAWLKVILPQVYPQIRLPIYAVLAFSLSVVDVALVLGPGNPPPLSVLAVRWFADADIRWYFPAAAAACLQLVVVAGSMVAWLGLERFVARATRGWLVAGGRGGAAASATMLIASVCGLLFVLAVAAIVGMALWSVAAQWRFPDALPSAWSVADGMRRLSGLATATWQTLGIGIAATLLALVLVLACLENEARAPRPPGLGSLWLLYVPLLVPQIAFLFGAQVLLVRLAWDGAFAAVIWVHLVFVLPYLFLSLADPWRALDPRYARTAASLGASPARVFARVKLPLLLRPILIACAVAFAVSVSQYLPTLFAGNGRVATLTTEAVTLAAGADRRVIGVHALAQTAFPLFVYLAAVIVPAIVYARRRGMERWG
jgi:putative thiamine transport system permease protein